MVLSNHEILGHLLLDLYLNMENKETQKYNIHIDPSMHPQDPAMTNKTNPTHKFDL